MQQEVARREQDYTGWEFRITRKNRKKRPTVKIDKSLDEFNNRVMFPKKLALAEELLKHAIFPKELQEKMKKESTLN